MSISVQLVGAADFHRQFAGLGAAGEATLKAAVHAGALLVQNAAKQRVPKRTRTLSRSITTNVEREGAAYVARIGPSAPYGKYIEFGTGVYAEGGGGRRTPWVFRGSNGRFYTTEGMRPQPYMRPAMDENRERVLKEIARTFRAALTRPTR